MLLPDFIKQWLIRRIDVRLVGLRAKLKSTMEAINYIASGSSIPGAIVYDMRDLPRQIAELEERRRQIVGKWNDSA